MTPSTYTRHDFSESLECAQRDGHNSGVTIGEVIHCIAAWGVQGREYADFTGGFLVTLKAGGFAYISGWSDSTGWG